MVRATGSAKGVAPLISVITPTWQRYNLLFGRCIPSVQQQDYPNVEHVIVHDGSPEEGAGPIAARLGVRTDEWWQHPVTFDYVAQHIEPGGRTRARLLAIGNADGELIAYLDDDDAYRPEHLSVLAAALAEHPEAGFAYSQMASHDGTNQVVAVIGQDPPAFCQIGSPMIVHRREILQYGTWGPDRPDEDWQLVARWLEAGVKYVYVPECTIDVWPSAYRGGG